MITAIWAQSKNNVIGNQGKLPWSLPDDLKFFKQQTTGKAIVMGRKTFESFGSRALPNRLNIILTHNQNFSVADDKIKIVHSPKEAIELAKKANLPLYVIGGAAVYQTFLEQTDCLLVTLVNTEIAGDTFAPQVDPEIFYLASQKHHDIDNKHAYSFDFLTYLRKEASDQV
ncbi:dihydrofolate reductase [Oenococcus kitaharae]|uniref:dihydrofolate reductase n=1 Tax=Oenococcus TaxID=46254 RepID=UPI0021E7CE1E|nr:dihydrofolate reductase [Oenococcus kitaharae]MCV3295806.1 dihydrofolate reductase [Oenococcus kitaharae]